MKKLLLFSALAAAMALPFARADDSVRSAQAVLQSQGFYTGPVDGELNADTKAAIRRYQIRNQLEATGELTAETASALNKEAQSAASTSTPVPQPAPSAPLPPVPARPAPQPAPPAPASAAFTVFFAHTPYEKAAPEIQVGTLQRAQTILAQRGLFRGVADGRPGPETEEALLRFQSSRELPKTGRLDIDTLAELHLLPVTKLPRPRVAPAPYVPEVPAPPRGAVRGVPLD